MFNGYFSSERFNEHKIRTKMSLQTLFKWTLCSLFIGIFLGLIGAGFYKALAFVTGFREANPYILFFLPLSGILIVFLYKLAGKQAGSGTNLVITAIQSNEDVPARVAPLIIVSTIITHLFGGSAGREGAALQVGGSIGNFFAKLLKFDDKDTRIMIMCSMSACFSALFGTPIAAAIFSMEVVSIGVMYYAALVPCVLSSFIAEEIANYFGIPDTSFAVGIVPELNIETGFQTIVMSLLFACASILLCIALHKSAKIYNYFFKNPYIKIIFAGALVVAMRYIFNTTDYLGAGAGIIAKSFIEQSAWYVFLLKILFTAATLGGGYKGGEIVPTLFVGATLGSFLSSIFGLPVGMCAACGMVSVFCGVTNCPITSFILAVEMFGTGSLKYCTIAIALSYLLSGYYSLYNSQKIVYSKYKTTYINKRSI